MMFSIYEESEKESKMSKLTCIASRFICNK